MSVASPGSEQLLPAGRRARILSLAVLAVLALAVVFFIAPALRPVARESSTTRISTAVYPSSLAWTLQHPGQGDWLMPADAVVIDDAIFVLDTGNNRLLKLDQDGGRVTVLASHDTGPALQMPMAIATDGRRLFIANSLAANVVTMDLAGRVENVIALPADETGGAPRPIGLAVMPDGGLVVSDAEHHRVMRLDSTGALLWSLGTGTRAAGMEGFNVPAGLTVDHSGNIYVVDTLNARIVELSPSGQFLREVGKRGDTAGTLARPKSVAVSSEGHIFVSDGLLAAVEVFDANGAYLGLIGRRDPADVNSTSLLVAPAGIAIANDLLLVTDRHAGLLAFELGNRP